MSPWLSRRAFVFGSLAVAASGVAQTSGRRLRIGFFGAAHSHFRGKYPVLRRSEDYELVGVHEDNAALRQAAPTDVRWLRLDELLRECDVVVVESAVEHHARNARLALEAGRHVHVEKPPATNLRELRDLLRVAARQDRRLQIGYMWRHNPGINAVLEATRQGWLGQVLQVHAAINTSIDDAERAKTARFPGGILFELGCHLIDPIVRLLGRPIRVTPSIRSAGVRRDALADNCVTLLEFERATATISSTALQPNAGAHRYFEVIGTAGTARVQPLEQPVLQLDLARGAGPYAAGRQEISFPPYSRYVDEFVALAQSIREGKPLPVTAADELLIQETLLKACRMS